MSSNDLTGCNCSTSLGDPMGCADPMPCGDHMTCGDCAGWIHGLWRSRGLRRPMRCGYRMEDHGGRVSTGNSMGCGDLMR